MNSDEMRWAAVAAEFRADQKQRVRRFWIQTFGAIIVALFIWFFAGCSMTVSPRPVVASQIAFDKSNQQTAGILSADQNGVVVSAHWMSEYLRMEKASN